MRLEELWEVLARQHDRPVFRRIDEVHPLDFYVGVDIGNDRVLMLVSDREPSSPPEFEALEVLKSIRGDGRWVLAIRLKRHDLKDPFSRLCGDVVESTRAIDPANGPNAVLDHLARWKRLMQLGRTGLSDSEARGLFGELHFLESVLIPKFGALTAIRGWTGPSDAPQDFRVPGMAIEIKTCQVGSNKVCISSLDQLESGGSRLLLVVTSLSPSVETDSSAATLTSLVQRIRALITIDVGATQEFEARLQEASFNDSDKAATVFYRAEGTRIFDVVEGFPRMTRSLAPQGVLDASYVLNLEVCVQFQTEVGVIGHGD